MKIDLTGADRRSSDEITAALTEMRATWPGIEPASVTVGPILDESGHRDSSASVNGTMGQTDNRTNDVRISDAYAKDYGRWQRQLRDSVRKGSLRCGGDTPAAYTMVHEFGHVVSANVFGLQDEVVTPEALSEGERNTRQMVLLAWNTVPPVGLKVPNLRIEEVPLYWCFGYGKEEIAKDLSLYATAGPQELIAEAFAVQHFLGHGVSKVADALMERMTAAYHRKFDAHAA